MSSPSSGRSSLAIVLQSIVHVEQLRLNCRRAAEGEQLPGQCLASIDCFPDVLHVDRRLRGRIETVPQKFRTRIHDARMLLKSCATRRQAGR